MNINEEIEVLAREEMDILALSKRYASVPVADLIQLTHAFETCRTGATQRLSPTAFAAKLERLTSLAGICEGVTTHEIVAAAKKYPLGERPCAPPGYLLTVGACIRKLADAVSDGLEEAS